MERSTLTLTLLKRQICCLKICLIVKFKLWRETIQVDRKNVSIWSCTKCGSSNQGKLLIRVCWRIFTVPLNSFEFVWIRGWLRWKIVSASRDGTIRWDISRPNVFYEIYSYIACKNYCVSSSRNYFLCQKPTMRIAGSRLNGTVFSI